MSNTLHNDTSRTTDQSDHMTSMSIGEVMYRWMRDLFPICRSLSGPGVRETLDYLGRLNPGLKRHHIASGETVFDWQVPDEWCIRTGYIEDDAGERIIDFANHNLHVMGYSIPVDQWMGLEELDTHLYSLPDQPEVIPYVTSYYKQRWGFCLSHHQRQALKPGRYRAYIDATLAPGHLDYADLVLPGREQREVLISTYVCHPSMANNELSGPVVAIALAGWLAALPERRYTYRFVFIPETIGSIIYISRNLDHLKRHVDAGFVITCVGDERAYSYLPSRLGKTLADRVALHVLRTQVPNFVSYNFLDRGSDERQYCAPRVDLPVVSIMRSKYGCYPEYHTSADDLTLVTPDGLEGAFELYKKVLTLLENNYNYSMTVLCEPQLGKRGMYPTISTKDSGHIVRNMMNVTAYCDGRRDLIELADMVGLSAFEVLELLDPLVDSGLVAVV